MTGGGEEEKLIRDCLADDPRAWDEFIRRYGQTARTSAAAALGRCGLGKAAHLVDEVAQKVFCELWEKKKLADLRDPRLLRPYVGSIAACRAIDAARSAFRSNGRHADWDETGPNGVPAREKTDGAPDPRQSALRSEAREIIGREIESLPFKEAFILRLSVEDDLTHQAIADLVGIPKDTVSTVIRRSREKIRRSLELQGFAGEEEHK